MYFHLKLLILKGLQTSHNKLDCFKFISSFSSKYKYIPAKIATQYAIDISNST